MLTKEQLEKILEDSHEVPAWLKAVCKNYSQVTIEKAFPGPGYNVKVTSTTGQGLQWVEGSFTIND